MEFLAADLTVHLQVPASSSDSTAAPGGPSDRHGDRGMLPFTGGAMDLLLALALLFAGTAAVVRHALHRPTTRQEA